MQAATGNDIMSEALGEFLQVAMWRRELHEYPELSFKEFRTAEFISRQLSREGIDYKKIAGTGILAVIKGRASGANSDKRAVVLRADIDALPLTESSGLGFASRIDGVMHACGHDMHTAVLLGALRLINRRKNSFSGTVFGLFQPGEEVNPGGASLVLDDKPFEGYDIVAFVGEHVDPDLPTGVFGFRKGQYMASSDELRFTVRGEGGHAAMRENIKDPVLAGAEFICRIHELSAIVKEGVPTPILSLGKVVANGATNVIPDELHIEGTMRVFDEELRDRVKEAIYATAREVEKKHKVAILVDINKGYPSVVNDLKLTERVVEATSSLFGQGSIVQLGLRPTADDFGFFCQSYPSVYYRLGVGGQGDNFKTRKSGKLHTSTFCPDEKALGYGVAQFANIALTILK